MKGSGFKGVINYILDPKKGTELIDSSGVRTDDISLLEVLHTGFSQIKQRVHDTSRS